MKKSHSLSVQAIFIYVVVIGFLFPRGYSEISDIYHKVCSVAMWLSVLLTWLQWFKCSKIKNKLGEGKIDGSVLQIGLYFIVAIIITIIIRTNISSGLQQLLAAPSV